MRMEAIYLDDRNTSMTTDWKYYRVSPIAKIHIEVCEVEFPTLKDKGVPTQHPFIVGLTAAERINRVHLKTLGIDQDHAILIGTVIRDEKGEIISASGQSHAELSRPPQ